MLPFVKGTIPSADDFNSLVPTADLLNQADPSKGAGMGGYNPALGYAHGTAGDAIHTIRAFDYTSLLTGIAVAKMANTSRRILICEAINIATTVLIDGANILIEGIGGDMQHDVGTAGANAVSKLTWTGASGGTILQFASPTGASAQKMSGGGVRNIFFNCNSLAGIGLQVKGWNKGNFESLHFDEPTVAGLDVNTVATLGEARDPQDNHFDQITGRAFTSSGDIVRLDGDASANTSFNRFGLITCQINNGNGVTFGNTDNNRIRTLRISRAGGGTGLGVEFRGSNAAADQVARANTIEHYSSNAPTTCRGTSSYTYPSLNNAVLGIDVENGTAYPTYEAGASGFWSDSRGIYGGSKGFQAAQAGFGETAANAILAGARLGTSGGAHITNGSGDHIQISDGANTNRWGINLNGANLRINRLAGAGVIELATTIQVNGKAVTEGAADSGGAGFKVLRVPN